MAEKVWLKELMKKLQERMGEGYQVLEVKQSPIVADGGIKLGIMKTGERTGILLDLNPSITQRFKEEIDLEDEVNSLAETYRRKRNRLFKELAAGEDFEKMKGKIIYALERKEGNEEALSHVPWKACWDMVIVFYMLAGSAEDMNYRIVSNKDLKVWNVNIEDIWNAAQKNTPYICPPLVMIMKGIVGNTVEEQEIPLEKISDYLEDYLTLGGFILTNKYGFCGASTVLYEGLMERIAKICSDDIVVIPANIHQVMIVPRGKSRKSVSEWQEILRNLNREESQKEEALSDSIYFYDRKEGRLRIAVESQ